MKSKVDGKELYQALEHKADKLFKRAALLSHRAAKLKRQGNEQAACDTLVKAKESQSQAERYAERAVVIERIRAERFYAHYQEAMAI